MFEAIKGRGPGNWWPCAEGDGRQSATLYCYKCGKPSCVQETAISPSGVINDAICPHCGYREGVKLVAWKDDHAAPSNVQPKGTPDGHCRRQIEPCECAPEAKAGCVSWRPAAQSPAPVPEIDYTALIHAGFERHKYHQGTNTCVAFKRGAEWFREQVAVQAPTVGDADLLRQAVVALEYHQEQTRPIQQTIEALANLKRRLESPPPMSAEPSGAGEQLLKAIRLLNNAAYKCGETDGRDASISLQQKHAAANDAALASAIAAANSVIDAKAKGGQQ